MAARGQSDWLDEDEIKALAGVWWLSLSLDDGEQRLTCNLDTNGKVLGTAEWPAGTAIWEASRPRGGDADRVQFRLSLGAWRLRGHGQRREDLRCSLVVGSVLEGAEDPVHVGEFEMSLAMPAVDEAELPALAARHRARRDAVLAPPPRYARQTFIGQWRLLIVYEEQLPRLFSVELLEDRSFHSEARPTLAGSWGVYDAYERKGFMQQQGTHLWLRVSRDRSTNTLEGIAGIPVFEEFSLYGRPVAETPEAELTARAGSGASVARINGHMYFGTSSDREYVVAGRFSLMRISSA